MTDKQLPAISGERGVNHSWQETLSIAEMLCKSGFFKDTRDVAQAVTKILYGRELGIAPVSSLMGIHIIEGKPAPSANLLAAMVKRSKRYDYRIKRWDGEAAQVEFFQNGESVGTSSFSIQEAQAAGLASKDNWKKYPKAMLLNRALAAGVRAFCPDLFGGAPVYDPEELDAPTEPLVIDTDTGEVVEDEAGAVARAGRRLHAVARDAGIDTRDRALMHAVATAALEREQPVRSIVRLDAAERHWIADWIETYPEELAELVRLHSGQDEAEAGLEVAVCSTQSAQESALGTL